MLAIHLSSKSRTSDVILLDVREVHISSHLDRITVCFVEDHLRQFKTFNLSDYVAIDFAGGIKV